MASPPVSIAGCLVRPLARTYCDFLPTVASIRPDRACREPKYTFVVHGERQRTLIFRTSSSKRLFISQPASSLEALNELRKQKCCTRCMHVCMRVICIMSRRLFLCCDDYSCVVYSSLCDRAADTCGSWMMMSGPVATSFSNSAT